MKALLIKIFWSLVISFISFEAMAQVPAGFTINLNKIQKQIQNRIRGNENSERVTQLRIGEPIYNGNGCPQGTMRIAFAPDNLSFSMLFDNFSAEVKDGVAPRRDVITCDTLIPIEIPRNMQMEISRVDYRGFVGLPQNSRAVMNSIFNFRGPKTDFKRIVMHYVFTGPSMEDYEVSTDAIKARGLVSNTEISPCGGNVHLRILNQLKVQSQPKAKETASVSLDSVDGAAHAIYFVNWRNCGSK